MLRLLESCKDYWMAGGLLLAPMALISFLIWSLFLRSRSALIQCRKLADASTERSLLTALKLQLEQWPRRDFRLLAALAAAAPLLGLLGTVTGMVQTFAAVADMDSETGSQVANGISQALITTQFGLLVALPGVFGLARLHRLARHVSFHLHSRLRLTAGDSVP